MESPSKSKKRKLDEKCIFCKKAESESKPLQCLDNEKNEHLFTICEEKGDDVSKFLLSNQSAIAEGEISIFYHKQCRSKFIHPFYQAKKEDDKSDEYQSDFFTRSKNTKGDFKWKENCFICGEKCLEKKRNTWSLVQSSIDSSSNLYNKVYKSAETRNDQEVLKRLLSCNGDLVAAEARYHRKKGCLSHYISQRNMSALQVNSLPKTACSEPLEQLKHEYSHSIIDQSLVIELATLKKRYEELCDPENEKIQSAYFKQLLQKQWPDVKFISRKGFSDLVCAKALTVDDALKKNINFVGKDETENENESFERCEMPKDDESILHKAAAILIKRVTEMKSLEKEYFSPEETSPSAQQQFLDPLLLKFVTWLSSRSKFDSGEDIGDKLDQKVVSICSDLTALISKALTPKHLGLSVYLHHAYGSKKLLQDLSCYGHTLPYTEVRHFLTSAAIQMASKQQRTESGALVPVSIKHDSERKQLVLAACDNWDHNERTLSGKKTTHAMTSLLASTVPATNTTERLPRVPDRSLNLQTYQGVGLSKVLPYTKPSKRPLPVLTPAVTQADLVHHEPQSAKLLRLKELLYNIGRCSVFCDDRAVKKDALPPWTVFQSVVEQDRIDTKSKIVFNPIIMAPPNEYNTVYTTLKRVKEQINALGQHSCPVFFDMGLLTKALEVVWGRRSEFEGVYPLEGGMHLLMCLFASVGQIFGTAGLTHLLCESDVYAKATAGQIFAGKDFDRGMRALLLIDETLHERFMKNFFQWAGQNCPTNLANMQCKLRDLNAFLIDKAVDRTEVLSLLENEILPLIQEFRSEGRSVSPLFLFWDDYLNHVSAPLKLFIATSRHAIFDANLYSKYRLMPLLFAANRHTYSRYMTYLLLQMRRLPSEVEESFRNGSFVTKLTNGPFNAVWMDYVLESTENKALKSSGGIIGLTHQDSALVRWFLSRPLTAEYSLAFHGNSIETDETDGKSHHTDTCYYRKAFNSDVEKMSELFSSEVFIDPFNLSDPPNGLVNFATGSEVPPDIQQNLLKWHAIGQSLFEKFVLERFVCADGATEPAKSFYDPVAKSKVKSMEKTLKTVHTKTNPIIAGEEMYLRLLAINAYKKVSLARVMSFENSTVPLSLFTDSGLMHSTKKSDFMAKLESLARQNESEPTSVPNKIDCIVFDAMAVVQMLQPPQTATKPTFSDMATSFWQYIALTSDGIPCVHVVFDNYDNENSLKSQTREKRGEQCASIHLQPNMAIPEWKTILHNIKSKKELTHLYTKHLALHAIDIVKPGQAVYTSGGFNQQAIKVTQDCVSFIDPLTSNQEEADTRMMLHLKYSSNQQNETVVVVSPDTDVLVLLLHHYESFGVARLFFKTGRKSLHCDNSRYIPVHDIAKALTDEQKSILLSIYCLTGCDTCSAFYSIGKKTVFKLFMTHAPELQPLSELGNSPILSANARRSSTYFIGLLYGSKACNSLDKLRMERATSKKQVKPKKLPPTDDSFLLHLLRCTYQLLIWKGSLSAMLQLPSPIDFGYQLEPESGAWIPQMMGQPLAPPELLSDLICKCTNFCSQNCVCSINEQPCTKACGCLGVVEGTDEEVCKNIFTVLADVTTDN